MYILSSFLCNMTNENHVRFSFATIFYISEDKEWAFYRKSDQLAVIADKIRFKERVEHLNLILGPILFKRASKAQ